MISAIRSNVNCSNLGRFRTAASTASSKSAALLSVFKNKMFLVGRVIRCAKLHSIARVPHKIYIYLENPLLLQKTQFWQLNFQVGSVALARKAYRSYSKNTVQFSGRVGCTCSKNHKSYSKTQSCTCSESQTVNDCAEPKVNCFYLVLILFHLTLPPYFQINIFYSTR